MNITIRYLPKRTEVWRMYWDLWKRRLWKMHVAAFAGAALASSQIIFDGFPPSVAGYALILIIGLIPILGFMLWPMVMFKTQTRWLKINSDGIFTTIGKKSGTVPWKEIVSIRTVSNTIVIQKSNLNSFVIPSRAFATESEKSEFLSFAHKSCNLPPQ